MGFSLDSSRPMLARNLRSPSGSARSARSSIYEAQAYSISTDPARQEIYEIEALLEKLENKKLTTQRFIPSQEKIEYLSKLALGAKLERALRRRMGEQDAVMRIRKPQTHLSEKNNIS